MTASSSFMLALSMGGVSYPWESLPIVALLTAALLLGIAFIIRLRTAPEPLIPLSILGDQQARLSIAANAFGWAPVVGLNIFLPIYLQNIVGLEPAIAGLSVLMLAVMPNISAGITGTILPRQEHYKTHSDCRHGAGDRVGAGDGMARPEHDAAGVRGAAVPARRAASAACRRSPPPRCRTTSRSTPSARRSPPCSSRATCSPPCWSRCSACWCWPAPPAGGRQPVFRRRLRPRLPRGRGELRGVARRDGPAGRKAAGNRAQLAACSPGFALSLRDERRARRRTRRRNAWVCTAHSLRVAFGLALAARWRRRQATRRANIPTIRSRSWSASRPAAAPTSRRA